MSEENIYELLALAKESLGIISTATARDEELKMIIEAGAEDMARAGVNINVQTPLMRKAIITFVKANFGISNPLDKERFMNSYRLCLSDLSLSEGYKQETEETSNE